MLVLGLGWTAMADSDDSDGNQLAGTWRVSVTTRDCTTGAPGLSFPALLTFARGGTMTGTTASRAFAPGQRSSDHGIWTSTEDGGYRAVSEAFILADSANPPFPLHRGVQRITQAIEVDRDVFSSNAAVKFFDVDGNVLVTGCATAVGRRMEVGK
jgi:hypothetical protein